jgi:hypothetical protein
MQDPPTPAENNLASIPTERVRDGPNPNRTFTEHRKAAKRTFPWDLSVDEIQLALPRPQGEDIRETKRPRLEEPFPTSPDEAITTKNTSQDTTVALPAATTAAVDHADSDPAMDMHSNARATTVPRRFTPEEDAKLTSVAKNSTRTKHDKECTTDSAAVAVLVPGRPSYSSIDPTLAKTGRWTTDEDTKLTDAVRMSVRISSNKNWPAISALVPGRTIKQCRGRWYNPSATMNCRADKDKTLKDAVPTHGDEKSSSHQQLLPSSNVARNNTPFIQKSLMEIFGFTPFGIYCRVCKDSVRVGPSKQAIFSHLQSKHQGEFTRQAVTAIRAIADEEIENLSRHANLELYLGDRSDGFACRCEAIFQDKNALARHCNEANYCLFPLHEARPELLFKTVCGRTVSQATLNRLSASSLPTTGLSNFARTQGTLGKYLRSDEDVGRGRGKGTPS